MTARLASLLDDIEVLEVAGDPGATEVTAVTNESARVVAGTLYCCVPGRRVDGHDLAGEVLASGATSLLVERTLPLPAVQVRVPSTRRAMGPVAAAFHGHPSRAMAVVGITGTNGKTTTAELLAAAAEAGGTPAGIIGTLSGERTTPEAPALQEALATMRRDGRRVVAMEVSSIALDQHRVDATEFAVAVWTNLSQDHLDYHETMEAYFEAKAKLFETGRSTVAVVNRDDAWSARLLSRRPDAVTYGLDDAQDLDARVTESRFRWRGLPVHLRVGGVHNVSNALAAGTAAEALGLDPDAIVAGLASVAGVPGRLEPVDAGQPFTVLVDYAHTPDGLERVLASLRSASAGRLIVVFGCGGDRDRAKRPLMGAVAARSADLAVLTSDNPRSEDAGDIIAEVAAGARGVRSLVVEPDRAAAIALAVGAAAPGDVVLVAGKGHETGQIVGDTVIPFDDRDVARRAVLALGQRR